MQLKVSRRRIEKEEILEDHLVEENLIEPPQHSEAMENMINSMEKLIMEAIMIRDVFSVVDLIAKFYGMGWDVSICINCSQDKKELIG